MSIRKKIEKIADYYKFKSMQGVSIDIDSSSVHDLLLRKGDDSSIEIGKYFSVRKGVIINVNKNGKLKVGKNVFFNDGVKVNVLDNVTIGDNVIIGQNVLIYDHDHDYRSNDIQNTFITKPITIGNNVWIGSGTIILKGVTIGSDSVIASGSIVTKDVPANSVLLQKRSGIIKTIVNNK